ncbi:MAG: cell wall hydrolase [Lachnospiraceae bacterium]
MKQYRFFLVVVSIILIITCIPLNDVTATTTQQKLEQAEKDRQEALEKLNEENSNLDGLQEIKNTLESELSQLNKQLYEVGVNLEKLLEQIEEKEKEIERTLEELAVAKEEEENQYESMKMRIKFMYEKQNFTLLEILFASESFSEFLNTSEYIEQLSNYDREKLEEFQLLRSEIEEKERILLQEREELEALKEEIEKERKNVSTYVNNTASHINNYSGQISDAEAKVIAYEEAVKAQESNIEELKKKIAEEKALAALAAQSAWRDISEVTFEEGDRYLLANIIYCEAGGESYAGQLAVGAVVINRLLSSVYPNSLVGVIYQNKQFSPVASGRLALALAENRATASCYKAADEAMAGQTNVGSCLYFRTPIEGLTGISIGGHIFY